MARRSKKLSREEKEEVELWIYQNNTEESRITDTMKVNVKCKTENQKSLINSIKEKEITICSGPAGTGKTYLACAEALKLIKRYAKYKKIVIVKSVTTLKNEEIGFLKGGLREKMEPFMFSFVHNFEKLVGQAITSRLRELKTIEELPIAYMRGINLDRSIIIIDEFPVIKSPSGATWERSIPLYLKVDITSESVLYDVRVLIFELISPISV